MITLILELIFNIVFLIFSIYIYLYRKKSFRFTIIRKAKRKENLYINYGTTGMIFVYTIFFILNFNFYNRNMDNNVILNLIALSQLFFWTSITIVAKSFKFSARKEDFVEFNFPSKREASEGEIKVGEILHKGKEQYDYYIKLRDLERHMFITGITGSGKSNFLQNFLVNYKNDYDTPILLAEFKGEYHYLQKLIPNLLIYKVGDNFCINIFDPEGTNADVHAERIFQIFRSGGLFEGVDYTPQMERVFVDILRRVCKDPKKRSWREFHNEAKAYLREALRQTGDITFKSSVQAVENRIRRYSLGTLKHTFETKRGLNVKELFKHDVLLDLSIMIKLGGEKEDTLFFLNMLLKYLWDKNIEQGSKGYSGIRHITIIEDAQYFASQSTTKRSTVSAYIEDIALLLRGTGECLISLATRPAVSPEILANCGIFITFQNHIQKLNLQGLLNFDEKKEKYLSMLDTGNCIIRVNSIGVPFALRIPLMKRSWLTDKEIKENNKRIIRNLNQSDIKDDKCYEIEERKDKPNQCDTKDDGLIMIEEWKKNKVNLKLIKNRFKDILKNSWFKMKYNERKKKIAIKKVKEDFEVNYCEMCFSVISNDEELCNDCIQLKELKEKDEIICILCKQKIKRADKFCQNCFNDLMEYEDFKELELYVKDLVSTQGNLPKEKTDKSERLIREA